MSHHTIVRCPRCGTDNRVPLARLGGRERPVCGRCRAPLEVISSVPREATDDGLAALIRDSTVPVLIDCWAPWCGPCRAVAPIVERIAASFGASLVVATLNVDENPRAAAQYGISGIPTLLLFSGGRLVDRMVGAGTEAGITGWLRSHGLMP